MKRMLVLACALALMVLTVWSQNVHAGPADQLYDRIEDQQRRIDDGIARRELNRREADSVQDNLNRIRGTFERMSRDRRLTPPEIRRLNAMLDDNGRMIARERHDSRPGPRGDLRERIENQQRRIREGVAKGQLTRQEAAMVQDNLDWIRATYERMTRDGMLTPPEAGRLEAMLDDNGRMISRERRDVQTVYHGSFEERIGNQQRRINEGIARRQLTRHEADAVQDNLDWIKATNDRMKRDRRLTWSEAARLDEMLDRNSRLINKERTDADYDNRFRSRFDSGF